MHVFRLLRIMGKVGLLIRPPVNAGVQPGIVFKGEAFKEEVLYLLSASPYRVMNCSVLGMMTLAWSMSCPSSGR